MSDALDARIEEHIQANEAYHEHVTMITCVYGLAGCLLFLIVATWWERRRERRLRRG